MTTPTPDVNTMLPFPTLRENVRVERLSLPSPSSRIVIDTDTNNEIDDQFAIVHALLSPSLDIEAVYAAPFVNAHAATPEEGMEGSYDEILNVYRHLGLGSPPPVFKGSRQTLTSYDQPEKSAAAEHLIETAFMSDEPLYVLAIAGITNVANALLLEPKLTERIVLVWLGGHAHGWHHTAEFNLQGDVLGSSLIFNCGVPLVQLPCQGVVDKLHTTLSEMAHYVEGRGAIGDYLYNLFAEHVQADEQSAYARSKELWDTAVIAYMLEPTWFESDLRPTPLLSRDEMSHRLTWSFDRRRHLMRYVYDVHRDPILRDFFEKLEAHAARS